MAKLAPWSELEKECRRLGWSGICPEAMEQIIDSANTWGWPSNRLRAEWWDFFNGMKELLAPK